MLHIRFSQKSSQDHRVRKSDAGAVYSKRFKFLLEDPEQSKSSEMLYSRYDT